MSRRPSPASLRREVEAWNADHGVRTKVRYWSGLRLGDGKPGWTWTEAMVLGGHTAGVYVKGAGFVALSHVEAVEP